MLKRLILVIGIAFATMLSSTAQEYQWCVPVKGYISPETNASPEAFLWIPSDCKKVRAVVFSQQNMCEEPIFNNIQFRNTLSELGFGIVWFAPGLNQQWDVSTGCQKVFESAFNDLAKASGYTELQHVPVIPLGHSAMATFPWNFAAWNPERTLAVISYHGDAPRTNLTGYNLSNLEWGRTRNIDGIPGLMVEGEFEWWEARVNPALAFRMMYPQSCVSFLCDAGHGHFDVSPEAIDYLCMFLKKAAYYRLTSGEKEDGTTILKKLNPENGWLAARWNATIKKRPQPASFRSYKGNPHDAFWYFDKETAFATEDYYARSLGKKTQYIGYTADGQTTGYNAKLHAGTIITPEFEKDGLTFHIGAIFTDSSRMHKTNRHAAGKISINLINGPAVKINDSTFTVRFYRMGLKNHKRTGDIWLQATNPGDKIYKSAVQQINIRLPYRNENGQRQYILFPGIQDVKEGTSSIELKATTDSGLPVYYYIKEGPASIDGNRIIFSQIPPRTKFPVKVTVVAWQYGVDGKYKTAEPEERTFYIVK